MGCSGSKTTSGGKVERLALEPSKVGAVKLSSISKVHGLDKEENHQIKLEQALEIEEKVGKTIGKTPKFLHNIPYHLINLR